MIITGRQIREARALLGLQRSELAAKVRMISTGTITRAESVDNEPPITTAQAAAIRSFLEGAGIEFAAENDGPGVRLRETPPPRQWVGLFATLSTRSRVSPHGMP